MHAMKQIDCCTSHNPFAWMTIFGKGEHFWSHQINFCCQIWGDRFWCDSIMSMGSYSSGMQIFHHKVCSPRILSFTLSLIKCMHVHSLTHLLIPTIKNFTIQTFSSTLYAYSFLQLLQASTIILQCYRFVPLCLREGYN